MAKQRGRGDLSVRLHVLHKIRLGKKKLPSWDLELAWNEWREFCKQVATKREHAVKRHPGTTRIKLKVQPYLTFPFPHNHNPGLLSSSLVFPHL